MKNWIAVWRGRDLDRDLRDEMQFHLAMRTAEFEQDGMNSRDAAAEAHKRFGSTAIAHEDTRRMHIGTVAFLAETAGRELRFACRSLRRAPAFSVVAILALALGIGSASAVFTVVDRILFRPLPYSGADRLVRLGIRAPIADGAVLLGGDYSEWKAETSAFESFTSTRGAGDCDITETNPVRVSCAQVESTFLPVLGVQLAAGRNFLRHEDQPNAARSAIISNDLWRERYGSDPNIENRRIQVDGRDIAIAGVLPRSFEFPSLAKIDVLLPQQLDEPVERKRASVSMLTAFGRLRPGVSVAQARTSLEPYFRGFLKTISPAFVKEVRLEVAPLNDLMRQQARTAAWASLGAILCVLFIAWTNVANLWLGRAASREHESAIRSALGAGRGRMMVHHTAEVGLVSILGWTGGLTIAAGLIAVLRKAAPPGIIGVRLASLDSRILIASAAVLALCALGFALLPASRWSSLTYGARIAGARSMRLRGGLVTAQLALSTVLVAAAGY